MVAKRSGTPHRCGGRGKHVRRNNHQRILCCYIAQHMRKTCHYQTASKSAIISGGRCFSVRVLHIHRLCMDEEYLGLREIQTKGHFVRLELDLLGI